MRRSTQPTIQNASRTKRRCPVHPEDKVVRSAGVCNICCTSLYQLNRSSKPMPAPRSLGRAALLAVSLDWLSSRPHALQLRQQTDNP